MRFLAPLLLAPLLLAACHSEPEPATPEGAQDVSAAVPEHPAPLATIRSASIELPADEETFGDDAHGTLLNRTCLACHSTSMVKLQPPLTRKQWAATVDKMHDAYGAPFDKSEAPAIVDALVATAPFKP